MKPELKTLANFLVQAKKNSWAGKGMNEELEYGIRKVAQYGRSYCEPFELRYIDQYVGGEPFQGFEVVSELSPEDKGFWKPIWAMSYSGEYTGTKKEYEEVINFLREALKAVPINAPFRGPQEYFKKNADNHITYAYFNFWDGNIKKFERGEERIYKVLNRESSKKLIYTAQYFGGLVNKR